MQTKNVLLIRRIEKKVDEDGREGYLGEEWGGKNERGIYRKYLFLREVSRVEVRREKEDKEHIEGNREKCPGETRRSFSGVSGKDRGVSA